MAALTLAGPTPFRGFLVTPATPSSGAFTVAPGGARLACGGIGHSSPVAKSAVQLTLALPAAAQSGGATTLSLKYFVVLSPVTWFGPLTATLQLAPAGGGGNATAAMPMR